MAKGVGSTLAPLIYSDVKWKVIGFRKTQNIAKILIDMS